MRPFEWNDLTTTEDRSTSGKLKEDLGSVKVNIHAGDKVKESGRKYTESAPLEPLSDDPIAEKDKIVRFSHRATSVQPVEVSEMLADALEQ